MSDHRTERSTVQGSCTRHPCRGVAVDIKNKVDQASGKAKETVGKITDDEKLEAEGRLQHDKAQLAEDADKLKKNVKDAAEHVKNVFKKY